MPLYFRKHATLGRAAHLSLSKTGVSASARAGRVTLNSRGRVPVRILPGVSYRIGGSRRKGFFG